MTVNTINSIPVKPQVHELSIIKQVMESRSNSLDILREALSNMCTPEVKAKTIEIQCYEDPDYGCTFIFKDDGCGMDYTNLKDNPGRLDRFINLGYGGAAGLNTDKFGWKGLGSKLMFNCRKLEISTWTGDESKPAYKLEVLEPRLKILQDIPEWPRFNLYPRQAENVDSQGTTIKVYGFEGGEKKYSLEELKQYLYWNTIIGATKSEDELPKVILKKGNNEEELNVGYKWIREKDSDDDDAWKTVLVNPPIEVTESDLNGNSVKVTLKGGFTLNTADACGPGIGLSRHRYNTGLRLSVLGIPFFRLDFYKLRGNKFQQYKDLCSFVVECDDLASKLNIDRSGYNEDDKTIQLFEKAVTKAFNKLATTDNYKYFNERRKKEDEKTKSKFLNKRKHLLTSPDQEYVVIYDNNNEPKMIHRVPNNEQDTLALFWKLEGLGKLPFEKFETLEHTNKNGIDVIANFQKEEDSQIHLMESVEFEYQYENFIKHEHNPRQTNLIVCWEIKHPRNLSRIDDYTYRSIIEDNTITVIELKNLPSIDILKNSVLQIV